MPLDANNPVVQLCVAGIACENQHRFDQALSLYMRAWEQACDDFEVCIAAHYVARHQKSAADALNWNLKSLEHANAVQDGRVREFYPSLYLNIGKSYEELGDKERAQMFYKTAAGKLSELSPGASREMVQDGISRGLQRVS
jgi:tetratricopeptide (TPR) repeat protein